jgi:hypothetical protein
VLDNLRYLARFTVATAKDMKLYECAALADLVYRKLDIPPVLEKLVRGDLLEDALRRVAMYERERAVKAGVEAIGWSVMVTETGDDRLPFLVAAASEVLGITNDEQLHFVRNALTLTDAKWEELKTKEGNSAKRQRQLCARLWLGARDKGDYSSKLVRNQEDDLLAAFERALEVDLELEPVRQPLLDSVIVTSSKELANSSDLSALDKQSNSTDDPPPIQFAGAPRWSGKFIQRQSLVKEFKKRRQSGATLINLTGQPGNGKSRLAYQLARSELANATGGVKGVWLRGETEIQLRAGIVKHFTACGVSIPQEVDELFLRFFERLCAPDRLRVVVIDNVTDGHLLSRVLPEAPASTVIITSEQPISVAHEGVEIVVPTMKRSESFRLARELMPTTTEKDLHLLCDTLGHLPLAITHAASLISPPLVISVTHIVRAIREAPLDVFRSAPKRHRALGQIYTQLLERMDRQDPTARRMLAIICLVQYIGIPLGFVRDAYVADYVLEAGSTSQALVSLKNNLQLLQDLKLIQVTDEFVEMNSLAHLLMSALLEADQETMRVPAYAAVRDKLEPVDVGTIWSIELHLWVSTAMHLLKGFPPFDKDDRQAVDMSTVLTAIARGMLEGGEAPLLVTWANELPLLAGPISDNVDEEMEDISEFCAILAASTLANRANLPAEASAPWIQKTALDSLLPFAFADLNAEEVALQPDSFFLRVNELNDGQSDGVKNEIGPDKASVIEAFDVLVPEQSGTEIEQELTRLEFISLAADTQVSRGRWRLAEELYRDVLAVVDAAGASVRLRYRYLLEQCALGLNRSGIQSRVGIGGEASERLHEIIRPGWPARRAHQGLLEENIGDMDRLGVLLNKRGDSEIPSSINVVDAHNSYIAAEEIYRSCGELDFLATVKTKDATLEALCGVGETEDLFLEAEGYLTAGSDTSTIVRFYVSRAKLRLIEGRADAADIRHCWRAAALAAAELNVYWHAEALMVAYLICRLVDLEGGYADQLGILREGAVAAYERLGRPDRVALLDADLSSEMDQFDLITD